MDGFFGDVSKNVYLDSRLQLEMATEATSSISDLEFVQEGAYGLETHALIIMWIFSACEELEQDVDTAYLAVNYFSRFLSTQRMKKEYLLEVAQACLLLAAKFNESNPPSVRSLFQCSGSDPSCLSRLFKFEKLILQNLDWKLDVVTVSHYVVYFCKNLKVSDQRKADILRLAMYFSRHLTICCQVLRFKTSQIALALVSYSRQTLFCDDPYNIFEEDFIYQGCNSRDRASSDVNEYKNLLEEYFSAELPTEVIRNSKKRKAEICLSSSPTDLKNWSNT